MGTSVTYWDCLFSTETNEASWELLKEQDTLRGNSREASPFEMLQHRQLAGAPSASKEDAIERLDREMVGRGTALSVSFGKADKACAEYGALVSAHQALRALQGNHLAMLNTALARHAQKTGGTECSTCSSCISTKSLQLRMLSVKTPPKAGFSVQAANLLRHTKCPACDSNLLLSPSELKVAAQFDALYKASFEALSNAKTAYQNSGREPFGIVFACALRF